MAASAAALAPDAAWQVKLEEIALAHRNRLNKLTVTRQRAGEMPAKLIDEFDRGQHLDALNGKATGSWPSVLIELIRAEDRAARHHSDFARTAHHEQGAGARAFRRVARQDRASAAELLDLLRGADYLWLFH
jgi:hypothetical protein